MMMKHANQQKRLFAIMALEAARLLQVRDQVIHQHVEARVGQTLPQIGGVFIQQVLG